MKYPNMSARWINSDSILKHKYFMWSVYGKTKR